MFSPNSLSMSAPPRASELLIKLLQMEPPRCNHQQCRFSTLHTYLSSIRKSTSSCHPYYLVDWAMSWIQEPNLVDLVGASQGILYSYRKLQAKCGVTVTGARNNRYVRSTDTIRRIASTVNPTQPNPEARAEDTLRWCAIILKIGSEV